MGLLFQGKRGVILGVANERSLGTGIAQFLHKQGAQLGFSYLPDDTGRGRMLARVEKATQGLDPSFILPCQVKDDQQLSVFFEHVAKTWDHIDFMVHSIAFAPLADIRMDVSVYSFMAAARFAAKLMSPHKGGAMLTLTYFGGEKVIPGYNMMGIVKAALESSVRYLAYDLGPQQIRVNGLSAGPVKTLASSVIGDFNEVMARVPEVAPLGRNITSEEIAESAGYLLSPLARGVTGEILHVDGGYHIMGASRSSGLRPT
jgi:enoyl-[acyl-carrier protein] reductase I